MTDEPVVPKKIEWKSVTIIFLSYVVFYVVPIVLSLQMFKPYHHSHPFFNVLGVWFFGGIMLIAFLLTYNLKNVTHFDSFIAGCLLFILSLAIGSVSIERIHKVYFSDSILPLIPVLICVFLFSLLGGWFGIRLRVLKQSKSGTGDSDVGP